MPARQRLGIQSVEIASRILAAMADALQPLPLKELARRCGMPAAKVHRYLVSLTRTKLVAQDNIDGRYSIGPASVALGLAGLHSLDAVRIASACLGDLRDDSGETAVLATWSGTGPVIIRIEESSRPVFMNVRVGSTLPLLRSAVGLVFAAYRADEEVRSLIAQERRALGRARGGPSTEERLVRTRRLGIGVVDGNLVPGVTALAAPIFDHRARIVASIALLGGPEHLEPRTDSPAARALKKAAAAISERLGYRAAV
ncbi:MAG TPA: IclR family transcriptional regulator [Stellaceae bacterium]|jgi:DNA-binding IclR family transcriptional regulator|nr:IclR family transcriptional regulator [Stellaceae bacterium]